MVEQCKRCIMNTGIPGVVLDENGECNYCKIHDQWDQEFPLAFGEERLHRVLEDVQAEGKGKLYDCIVGVSGGADSSWLLDYLVEFGMNPLAVHFDNNWNTQKANENMRKITQGLGLDLYKIGVPRAEYDDLCKAFLLASVPDADVPNDIALTTALYQACERFDCKYIMNAHSFRTEGTAPLGFTYMDGGYIESVHREFGSVPLKRYPNLDYESFKNYIRLGIERIRPLWYLNYDKEKAIKHLEKKFGWQWYGAHHHENTYTIFVSAYLWPLKFGMDARIIEYSALIRSGWVSRNWALRAIREDHKFKPLLPYNVRRRLGISKADLKRILAAPVKSYRDYETYQDRFKDDATWFKRAWKDGLIPETFYRKYVLGVK